MVMACLLAVGIVAAAPLLSVVPISSLVRADVCCVRFYFLLELSALAWQGTGGGCAGGGIGECGDCGQRLGCGGASRHSAIRPLLCLETISTHLHQQRCAGGQKRVQPRRDIVFWQL